VSQWPRTTDRREPLRVGGLIGDLRAMPRDVPAQAFDACLIPFIPADRKA